MKRILVIGGGSIGKRHLRNLLALGEKNITVVETNESRAQEIAKEFSVPTVSNMMAAFAAQKFEIAFICSPSRFHMEQAILCAEHGCDLFIEKPLSHTLNHVDELDAAIRAQSLVTMVGSNWKFYPLFVKMKELLEVGVIGRVLSARCEFGQYLPDWHPWEDHRTGYSANKHLGGGILLDSHEFDYMTWFLGTAVSVSCLADRIGDVTVDTEDVAAVILRFASGAIGEMHLDYLQRFYQRNYHFIGEKGNLHWDVHDKQVTVHVKGAEDLVFRLPEQYDTNGMYIEEIKHFLHCVDTRTQTTTPVERGAQVLKLISAAKESAQTGKVINVS